MGRPSCSLCSRSWAIVLISPLWPRIENGCTRLNVGYVFVEYRLWAMIRDEAKSSSPISG